MWTGQGSNRYIEVASALGNGAAEHGEPDKNKKLGLLCKATRIDWTDMDLFGSVFF